MSASYNTYLLGQVAGLTGRFTQNDVAIDPSTVAVVVSEPNGAETTYTYGTDNVVSKVGTGQYLLEYQTSMPGVHFYRWVSTGNGAGVGQRRFDVTAPEGAR